jgi:chitodextrinase
MGALVATGLLAGGLALVAAVPSASAVYAANGEPVWIPRNAANAGDQSRADNRALARVGSTIFVGGDFTEVAPELGAPGVAIANLAAFDATTGVPVASFQPQLDGKVYALVADAGTNTLYVGGSFTGGFAILDATTGARKGAQLTTDGEVRALYRDGNDMYVGGQFQRFGSAGNRKMMARFNVSTLTVDGFAPQFTGGMVGAIDMAPNRIRVYAGGRFSGLNGAAVGKVVALNPGTGALDPSFAPPINTTKQPVEDIEALNTKVLVAFGGGYNRFVQFAAGGAQEFGSCGDGDVQEIHVVDDPVNSRTVALVGGHFAGNPKRNCTLATIPTARIAEYQVNDVAGSLPVVVNPTPFSNVYANELGVWEFLGTSMTDLWVAGDFLKVSSRNTGGVAHFFDGQTYTDGQNPSVPGNVQVTGATPGSLTVSWSASTDNKRVAGYYVLVNGTRRATALGTSGVVAGLAPGTTYSVQVQAFDVRLNTSALSSAASGTTTADASPPSAPTNVRVLDGSTSDLDIGWNASTDDGTVTEYRVFADGALLGTTSGLSLRHNGLAPASPHTYQVVAQDAGGNLSTPSATLTARAYRVVLPAGATWRYRDQGALADFAWRETNYDDSGWASGAAPLGYGASGLATTIGWGPNSSNRYLTSYARTAFQLSDVSTATGLTLRIRGTDGAAVFVNGQLAYNDNLPAALEPDLGALTARDTAARDIVREFRVPINPGLLVTGTNVVAVEFHKYAPNSTYLAFSAELSADATLAVAPAPPAPATLTATVAGTSVQLAWAASTGATAYEVRRDGTPITTVTGTSYTDAAPGVGTFTYTVRAIGGGGQASGDSPSAQAVINPPPPPTDTTAPAVPAKPVAGAVTSSTVALTWPAATDNVGVTGYRVFRNGTAVATTPVPSFTDSGLSPSTAYTYKVSAYDAAGNESARSTGRAVTTAAATGTSVLGTTTAWSLTDTRVDLGTTWKDPGYAVAAPLWRSGVPQFGFGDADEATVVGRGGTTNTTGVITWYFRTTFAVANPAAVSALVADLVRDDGAVVYLNGVEVFRTNMPAGPVGYTTKASASLGGADERTPVSFSVPASALVAGTNVIAVELHNVGPLNDDASFQLTARLS